MKKRLLATAVATMLVLSTGIAMASPEDGVKLDGSVSLQYRHDTGIHEGTSYIGKFLLNANVNLDSHFDFYTRFAAENLSKADSSGKDFIGLNYDGDKQNYAGIDLFGLKYQNAGFHYVIGRQTGNIGATGTLYNTESYMGKDVFMDGVSVAGKSGVTDLKAVIAEDKYNRDSNKIYALSGSYNPSANVTLGATLAKYDVDNQNDKNYWAVNAGYNLGKASFVGEYAKSDSDSDNKAYNVTANYAFDAKNSVYVTAHRTEVNADIDYMTNFDNNQKGFYYGYDYKLDKDSTISVFYKDNTLLKDDGINHKDDNNKSFRTTFSVKF